MSRGSTDRAASHMDIPDLDEPPAAYADPSAAPLRLHRLLPGPFHRAIPSVRRSARHSSILSTCRLRSPVRPLCSRLERDASRLVDCRARLNFSPLGACALASIGLPIDRFMTSKALGFTAPLRNRFATSVADKGWIFKFVHCWRW